jgi:twitching motility protein PilT
LSYEILINTLAVSNVISEGKIFKLRASMQIGSKSGMCTIDQNLLELFKQNRITYEAAKDNMRDQSVIHLLNQEQAKRVATAK